ncbi:MAG: cyclopropane fatty acyl phospholipid synthase [Candidatus Doudnabacteria bacterium]|nr:cyclopropane fatty acyl phospholipid synthase [Candidatus Doudnabacteria bacterium]
MGSNRYKKVVQDMLAQADVQIGGNRPWDIKVFNEDLYKRAIGHGSKGLGEAYTDGWWDSPKLDEFFFKVLDAGLREKIKFNWTTIKVYLTAQLFNLQTIGGSKKVVKLHYDLSTELYLSFLDEYNQYTCGYFKDTNDLNIAQQQKLQLICDKLQLKKEDRVLDIGCGWGGFAKFASERFECNVTGITISKEQATYAREFTKGLPVTIKEMDYRSLDGEYDKILICGMIEHVGYKNYERIFKIVKKVLSEKGLFLLHTIGNNEDTVAIDPWIEKYIFPNSVVPSLKQIINASTGLFVLEDLHNFGKYYDHTLMAWFKNFDTNWPKLKVQYGERFYRMWKYYLLSCAGLFRARQAQLWQMVFSKNGILEGYKSAR